MITMIGSIKPKRIILRLISILIICVFSLDTVVWTQPKKAGIQTYSAENLQVQSLFSPVINVIGKAYKTQLRVETAMLLAMVLKNKEITYPSLNAEMNKWNEHILREKTKSILRVISNPRQTEKGIAINVEIKQGKQGQKRFTIISMCKNIEDIQKDENKIKIISTPEKYSQNDLLAVYKEEALLGKDHAVNVGKICKWIANEIGLDKEEIKILINAAKIHDIGKTDPSLEDHFCSPEEIDRTKRMEKVNGHIEKSVEIAEKKGMFKSEEEKAIVLTHHKPDAILENEYVKKLSEEKREKAIKAVYILSVADMIDAYYISGKYRPYRWVAMTDEKINGKILERIKKQIEKTHCKFLENLEEIALKFLKGTLFTKMEKKAAGRPYFWGVIKQWKRIGKGQDYLEIIFDRIRKNGNGKEVEEFMEWINKTKKEGERFFKKEEIERIIKNLTAEIAKRNMKKIKEKEKLRTIRVKKKIGTKKDKKTQNQDMPSRRGIKGNVFNIKRIAEKTLKKTNSPINFVIDLSLFPSDEIMKEIALNLLAEQMLRYKNIKNTNFVFVERKDFIEENRNIGVGQIVREEKRDIIEEIKEKIRKAGAYTGGTDLEEFLNKRVGQKRTAQNTRSIEIGINTKTFFKTIQAEGISLRADQYPIAMEDTVFYGENNEIIHDFETAFALGIIKGALVLAKRRDEERDDGQDTEFNEIKDKMTEKIRKLYLEIFPLVLNKKTNFNKIINNMVYSKGRNSGSLVRLGFAIDLALPPVERQYIDELVKLHVAWKRPEYSA